jgi:flavorubredoxin
MVLECGDATFELKYFGEFHSNSDILIYVPEIKVLFTGDLFTRYGRPSMNESLLTDQDKWINAIRWINQRINNITCVIDGHGQVLSTDDLKRFNDIILEKYNEAQTN